MCGWEGYSITICYVHIEKNSIYFMQCLLRRASSFSDKQSPAVVVSSEKKHYGSLPGAGMSCLKQTNGEEAGQKQLLRCKEEGNEPYIPIMMVSTC